MNPSTESLPILPISPQIATPSTAEPIVQTLPGSPIPEVHPSASAQESVVMSFAEAGKQLDDVIKNSAVPQIPGNALHAQALQQIQAEARTRESAVAGVRLASESNHNNVLQLHAKTADRIEKIERIVMAGAAAVLFLAAYLVSHVH